MLSRELQPDPSLDRLDQLDVRSVRHQALNEGQVGKIVFDLQNGHMVRLKLLRRFRLVRGRQLRSRRVFGGL